jgi:hypothetical protein
MPDRYTQIFFYFQSNTYERSRQNHIKQLNRITSKRTFTANFYFIFLKKKPPG